MNCVFVQVDAPVLMLDPMGLMCVGTFLGLRSLVLPKKHERL